MGRLLAVTGGHRYDHAAFAAMLDAVCAALGWEWAHAVQPAARRWMSPEHAATWDVMLLHDLPGLALARGAEPEVAEPSPALQRSIVDLLAAGQGIVATHHALAGWPAWDAWADALGGRFLYAPGRLHGRSVPASGYRLDSYSVDVAAPDHPVCEGIERFRVDDELYLCPVLDGVTPLLCTDAEISPQTMFDAHREVRFGERVPPAPQPASPLLGWCQQHGPSRVVYVLPGHSPATMEHGMYRRLMINACRWAAGGGVRP